MKSLIDYSPALWFNLYQLLTLKKLHNFVVQNHTLRCAEPHTPCAENNQQLHNFVVQTYNELLILDCVSNRVQEITLDCASNRVC